MSREQNPQILSATAQDDFFYIKYRQGKQEYIACEPYTEELYKQLIPYLRYA